MSESTASSPTVIDTLSEIGDALRQRRIAYGLTQAEIAARCGVSTRLWGEVERGERAHVSSETLLCMLQFAGFDVLLQPRKDLPVVRPDQRRVR